MAIHQTKHTSDIEKRLRLLRQQVYGRSSDNGKSRIMLQIPTSSLRQASHIPHPTSPIRSDIIYLRHDLIKIGTLASAAFTIQAVLYYLLKNNILNLNFF